MEETTETEPLAKWLKPHLEYHPQLQTKDAEGGKSQLQEVTDSDLFVSSFTSTSLSWLMQLYCKSRRWTVLVQLCYSPLINCLGPSLCLFRFTLASECWYLQNTCWDFNWYCIESTDQVRKNQHPDNIESFCTWTQNLSPFI